MRGKGRSKRRQYIPYLRAKTKAENVKAASEAVLFSVQLAGQCALNAAQFSVMCSQPKFEAGGIVMPREETK